MTENQEVQNLHDRLNFLRKRILTLEWDKSHNQLNSGMEEKYNSYKKEFEALNKQDATEEVAEQESE